MDEDFRNRTDYRTLAMALGLWAAHFGLLWVASSVFPDQPAARWIALALTLVAAAGLFWLWRCAGRPPVTSVAGLGLAIAAVGIAYDFAPAVVG
ncbi:hypothetical protein [Aurantiacibacter hainanensis]|uniref:hypothetical protein n=1 Tax=Aurantiacibacter hainanensis TaxID=3076114 RepID=UPI0030C6873D